MSKHKLTEQEKAFYFYTKKRFRLFLALSLVCAAVFVALLVLSFFFSSDSGPFFLILIASLIPLAGMIVLGRFAVEKRNAMTQLEKKARGDK